MSNPPYSPETSHKPNASMPSEQMKTIGIIGGLAWPSTTVYYQEINKLVSSHLGGLHCAKLVILQDDFDQINQWESSGDWDKVGETLLNSAERLKAAHADFILIACNTVHKALPSIQDKIPLPLVHIVDVTGQALSGYGKVGLLGSRFTMNDDYFAGRLVRNYGLEVVVPPEEEQEQIQTALKGEFARGVFLESTTGMFSAIMAHLVQRGANAIVLGCTEFGRVVRQGDSSVPIVDTLMVHCNAAASLALGT